MPLGLGHVARVSPYVLTFATILLSLLGDSSVIPQREAGGCGGGGGSMAGIAISKGVLRTFFVEDPTGEQTRKRIDAAKIALNPQLQQKSKLRKISLQRLEQAIAKQLASDRKPTDDMRYLAGLTRIQHVFFYPETGDIVIAGPAEGWFTDMAGRVQGMHTGRAILELQDLVTALRAYPPGGTSGGPRLIGCSIDATKDGLAAMNQFLNTLPKVADASMATNEYAEYIVNGLRTNLGLQKVRIMGVPPTTHFAQIMVEADYRMKLIGIGMEQPPVKIVSYVDRADPSSISRNGMQRWWFVPDYKCLKVAEDELAMEIVGNGVKLLGEDEMVAADGTRQRAEVNGGAGNRASQSFVVGFTQKYPELAVKSYVYGQLRNLIDMTVAAVFIQKHDYYSRADWKMPILGDEEKLPVQVYEQPVEVESAVTYRWKGGRLMTPVGGGVSMNPEQAFLPDNMLKDDGKPAKARQEISLQSLAEGQWWWD